jgi:hypothetical protein
MPVVVLKWRHEMCRWRNDSPFSLAHFISWEWHCMSPETKLYTQSMDKQLIVINVSGTVLVKLLKHLQCSQTVLPLDMNIVACEPVARQRPRNNQIFNIHC